MVHIKLKLRTFVLKLWAFQGNKQNQVAPNAVWFSAALASPQKLLEIQILRSYTYKNVVCRTQNSVLKQGLQLILMYINVKHSLRCLGCFLWKITSLSYTDLFLLNFPARQWKVRRIAFKMDTKYFPQKQCHRLENVVTFCFLLKSNPC